MPTPYYPPVGSAHTGSGLKRSLRTILSRSRRTVSSFFKRSAKVPAADSNYPPPAQVALPFVCWGVLGVGRGSMEAANVGWMVADYAWWVFLLHNTPTFDEARSNFHVLNSLRAFFPDGRGTHGEAGCRRLRFSLHPSLLDPPHPPFSASEFKVTALANLFQTAMAMKAGETLLLLLIGHGSGDHGCFHLWVTTELGLEGGPSFTKEVLEAAVSGCKARIVVISNARQSGLLKSDRWSLVCAAHPKEKFDALAQSSSGCVRGSMFTTFATAQMVLDFGLDLPRPRADKRSTTRKQFHLTKLDLIPLPPSPPPHSLSPGTTLKIEHPTDRGIRALVEGANSHQEYLLFEAGTAFNVYPSPSADVLPWRDLIPIPFTETMVASISLYSDDAEGTNGLFGVLPLRGGSSAPRAASKLPDHLRVLAVAYAKFVQAPCGPEARDIRCCAEYLQHLRSPSVRPPPFQGSEGRDFYKMLKCRNVQSVAVQLIAKGLGWWEGEVAPFVMRPFGDYRVAKSNMQERGMSTYLIIEELHQTFSWLSQVEEAPAISWLISEWLDACSPTVPKELWEAAVAQAAATAGDYIHPNYTTKVPTCCVHLARSHGSWPSRVLGAAGSGLVSSWPMWLGMQPSASCSPCRVCTTLYPGSQP
ncbi:hypothetical protein B0H19DRAFT_206813 [Mycena capillaripes]|nr:hypothetical protein B0H19DRAFT_206813 [Mycena capillaripes]